MVKSKQHFRDARLQRHHGRLIDVAPGKAASADDVVHFVAKNSVAEMLRHKVSDKLNRKFDGRKHKSELKHGFPVFSRGASNFHGHSESIRRASFRCDSE